ncbi:MAG: hypothetical protein US75_C0008G0026 [Candidatus Woesebacteria bacterium GW2011_GWC1_38_13]|uniref:SCP domain-containing protein n=1 Tax=Candidatus Woesebacteria bacterium GW2011_GWC1_38_13 TaxID=1618583 RepID=A0A0G0LUI5_9BACT|nr:MAG: hypothetical protein US75_C0008G0026 [Candidatus Woesebacteria bacterium GW2011_GWC1_38_13]
MSTLSYIFSHYLLPGYSNNQKAKLLHNSTLLSLILFLALGRLIFQNLPGLGIGVLGFASQLPVEEIVRLTNEKRSQVGMGNLVYNPTLSQAAKAKGEDMLAKDYWAHVAPDGTQPWKFFTDVGYKYKYAGENLAKDFSSPSSAIEAWMASSSHKENMLSSKYDEIGIAVVEGDMNGVDTTIIVQLFGKRYESNIAAVTSEISAKTEVVKKIEVEITPIPSPTFIPLPTVSEIVNNSNDIEEIGEYTYKEPTYFQVLISPFSVKKGFSTILTLILIIAFIIDGAFLVKGKALRVGGRTFAHIIFLCLIFTLIILFQSGELMPPITDSTK